MQNSEFSNLDATLEYSLAAGAIVDSLAADAISRGFRPATFLLTTKSTIWWGCKNAGYSDAPASLTQRLPPLAQNSLLNSDD
ncbi:hypothetical protein FACHB389_02285 [Nostoc calcicola FACHB-389]|nr:hypothetical protein FACHB389_02285 [Nostoc calcicola FACHB-389]